VALASCFHFSPGLNSVSDASVRFLEIENLDFLRRTDGKACPVIAIWINPTRTIHALLERKRQRIGEKRNHGLPRPTSDHERHTGDEER
jgi:hypothetical protein